MRRGEEPSRAVRIDGSTRVIQGEETFTVHTEGEAELELAVAAEDGEKADWVGDIREQREDWLGWHQAATSQMEILSPSRKVGGSHSDSQTGNILLLIFFPK